MIQVLTWSGDPERTLGAEDLDLRDNEWCWSISPIHDGRMNVVVTDVTEQDYVHTYQVNVRNGPLFKAMILAILGREQPALMS